MANLDLLMGQFAPTSAERGYSERGKTRKNGGTPSGEESDLLQDLWRPGLQRPLPLLVR